MATGTFILLLIGAIVLLYAVVAAVAYFRMRGTHIVVCPETHQPAAVHVDGGHAALSAVREKTHIELNACSRWEGAPQCDQACAGQIAAAPADTRPSHILRDWFVGKRCALCGRTIPPIHHAEQHPGLMNIASPDRDLVSWNAIPADEHLPEVLESHVPVCANCSLVETFRREFPDLVTDRPEHRRQ